MPVTEPLVGPRSLEELRRDYELERTLAQRLRDAPAVDRPRLYGEVYDAYYREVEQPPVDPAAIDLQVRALQPLVGPDTDLLEVGGGAGGVAAQLAPGVRRVLAVEVSAEVTAEVAWPENVELVVADATALNLPDACVDLAYSCHFLEHLHPDDAPAHAAEVRRVLRPGGCYLAVTPNRLWGPHDVSRHFDEAATGFHLREYTHGELADVMSKAGFSRVRTLRGLGGSGSDEAPLWPVRLAEGALARLPTVARRRFMQRFLAWRPPPFRPLEQVKVLAYR